MAASTFREHDGSPDASSEMITGMCPGRLRCVRWPRITYCAGESILNSSCACAHRGHGYNTRRCRQLHVLLRTWLSAVRNSMEWWKLAIGEQHRLKVGRDSSITVQLDRKRQESSLIGTG